MNQGMRENWRVICEAVLREKDGDKLNELFEELLESLDERSRTQANPPSETAPLDP